MRRALRDPAFLKACAVALALNVALWAFLAYQQPGFYGARADRFLVCF